MAHVTEHPSSMTDEVKCLTLVGSAFNASLAICTRYHSICNVIRQLIMDDIAALGCYENLPLEEDSVEILKEERRKILNRHRQLLIDTEKRYMNSIALLK